MLELPENLLEELRRHAEEGYPAEVCGLLLGLDGKVRRITATRRATNLRAATTRDRYEVDPQDIVDGDREARERNLMMLGFYHSHPDHPAAPSRYDTERAWPWYSYVILAATAEGAGQANAWRREGTGMVEESLRFISPGKVGESEHE
ncbi:MAG: M67 family metallopeptidase [Candidatus Thermoplasmatota archaeon]|nr:M67 family metallopeptidase [Candidatus Thermoplasmatota archaeon]